MNLLERFGELGKALFNTRLELQHAREEQAKDRQDVKALGERLVALAKEVQELRERVVRLETQRDADREQMKAELARFMLDVERAALRQERSQLTSPLLPEKQD